MSDLVGFISIILVFILTMVLCYRFPNISKILYIALALRVVVLLLGHYLIILPDSSDDASSFEAHAWILAQDSFIDKLNNFGPGSYFISWLISIPYSLFGRSLLMAQSISLFFGMAFIFLGWKLSKILWNDYVAKKVIWTIALFPSCILYSVLLLREIYVCFFLTLALYGVITWSKTKNFKSIILAMTGFIFAFFFHGALIFGSFVFLFIIFMYKLKTILISLKFFRVNLLSFITLILSLIPLILFFSNNLNIPKIGYFEDISNLEKIFDRLQFVSNASANYPDWLKIKSQSEILFKSVLRAFYFIYSPLPWDVNKLNHLIGIFDSVLYMIFTYLIFCNRKVILKDPTLKFILVILVVYLIIFGLGVENFGTAIRQRFKFMIIFVLLAAPLIPRIFLFKK
jgi:hypothetical protein